MKAATRSRWLLLTRRRAAARRGRQLLEEKRQALIRAILRSRAERDAARDRAAEALANARAVLEEARIELGGDAVEAAGLAQGDAPRLRLARRSLLGVAIFALQEDLPALRLRFSPGGTSESLDRAAAAFGRALPLVIALAGRALELDGLRAGLARTSRRSNALDRVVLPSLDHEIRWIESSLEEEARDEAVRGRRRAGHRTESFGFRI